MRELKPLEKVYWIRLALGFVAALVCIGYAVAAGQIPASPSLEEGFPTDITLFFNSTSIALVIYMLSYYPIKSKFINMVQKPQKLVTTGIGIYFISWLVFWVMIYTILVGPPLA
ncbi:MAG: hypothetical protein QW840_02360 [Candidatus Bathyarchaeia archaeon]